MSSGPSVVLLRGLGRVKEHWGAFPELITKRFQTGNVVCVDLPGAGDLKECVAPLRIDDYVAAIRQHYRNQLPKTFHLVGMSLGGMIACAWQNALPEAIASLTLINSSSRLSPPWQRLRPQAYWKFLETFAASNHAAREANLAKFLCNNDAAAQSTGAAWAAVSPTRLPTRAQVIRQLTAASRWRPAGAPTGGRPVAIAILTSRADRLVDWRCSKDLAQHLGAHLDVHEHAGHELTADDPVWVLEHLPIK